MILRSSVFALASLSLLFCASNVFGEDNNGVFIHLKKLDKKPYNLFVLCKMFDAPQRQIDKFSNNKKFEIVRCFPENEIYTHLVFYPKNTVVYTSSDKAEQLLQNLSNLDPIKTSSAP